MLKKIRVNRKLNNKGLTLVEVIIAMVILMVAIIPTLRIFSTTSGFNAKARRNMQSITVAESVMETFKAYSVEDLCKQYKADGVTYCSCGKPISECSAHGEAKPKMTHSSREVSASATMIDSDYKLNEAADDFTFKIYDLQEESRKFNVRVDVKKVAEYDKKILKTERINEYTDAIVQLDASSVTGVYDALKLLAEKYVDDNFTNPTGYVADSLAFDHVQINNLDRVITVTADAGKATYGITYDYKMDIVYKYRVTDASGIPSNKIGSFTDVTGTYDVDLSGGGATPELVKTVFDNSSSGATLENIYFYYFPLYADSASLHINAASDEIDFVNNSSNKITVHVARQKPTTYSQTQLAVYEASYKLTVDGSGVGAMDLQHNKLNERLDGSGSVIAQCVFGGKFGSIDVAATSFENATQDKKALLYSVQVYVFNEDDSAMTDTGNAVASFSGTKND